jgi:hypothetical protein
MDTYTPHNTQQHSREHMTQAEVIGFSLNFATVQLSHIIILTLLQATQLGELVLHA